MPPSPPTPSTPPSATPGPDHWFEPVAEHLGGAYLRYSFTRGTEQEVAALVEALDLRPGQRVLDVGCGPGRHAHALARRGLEVVGVDISQRFVDLAAAGAPPGATFRRADARALGFDAEFDAAISLCQGAFGLAGGPGAPLDADGEVLDGIARALRPGGVAAVSAFSAYFQVRWLEEADTFDAETGVNHERTTVRDEAGAEAEVDLWTTCFTPRELRLLAARAGLAVRAVWSVTPGAYAPARPTIETPELLLVAERPARA
ncbi:MAG TPA: methyltransferase domain-containing protein [Acidimicrobiales bacterium]